MFVEFDPTEELRALLAPTMSPQAVERFVGRVEPTIGFFGDEDAAVLTRFRIPLRTEEPIASMSTVWPSWGDEPLALACVIDLTQVPEMPQWPSKPDHGWLCLFVPSFDGGAWQDQLRRIEQHDEVGFDINPGGYSAIRIVDDLGFESGAETDRTAGVPLIAESCGLKVGWSVQTNSETLSDEEYRGYEAQVIADSLGRGMYASGQLFGCFDYRLDVFADGGTGRRSFLGISTGDGTYATYVDPAALEANDFSSFSYVENAV